MKKNGLLSDEIWAFQPIEAAAGEGALRSDRAHDIEFGDDGDPYQLALNAASVSSGEVYAAKPVASIATLASYLVTGFWQYNNTVAHHFASNTITFNIGGLNSAEQFLALYRQTFSRWTRIAIRPEEVRILDFQARFPSAWSGDSESRAAPAG